MESRIKRLYSIQQKLAHAQKIPVEQVYDLLAIRVICHTEQLSATRCSACCTRTWRPVPGRIKDFIAMPRPNLYQSLHTTLDRARRHQFEVQMRTEEMHRIAEEGHCRALEVQGGRRRLRRRMNSGWRGCGS